MSKSCEGKVFSSDQITKQKRRRRSELLIDSSLVCCSYVKQLMDTSLSGDNDQLIHLTKLFKETEEDQKYQNIELTNFDVRRKLANSYHKIILE